MTVSRIHCPSCVSFNKCEHKDDTQYCKDYIYNPTWNHNKDEVIGHVTHIEEDSDGLYIHVTPAQTSDNVNHPNHYTQGGIECIEAIRASMSPSGFQDYCKGNVLKYIWRWRDKGGIEDLAKAQVYLSWLIDSAEKEHKDD